MDRLLNQGFAILILTVLGPVMPSFMAIGLAVTGQSILGAYLATAGLMSIYFLVAGLDRGTTKAILGAGAWTFVVVTVAYVNGPEIVAALRSVD